MKDKQKRYELWLFEQNGVLEANNAAGNEDFFSEAVERNMYHSVTEWGEKIAEYDTEEEASKASGDLFESMRSSYNEIFIWDTKDQYWFN